MKKLLGAVLPLLLAFLGTSCAFEGAVTTTAHTETSAVTTTTEETTTVTTTTATTTATTSSAAADEEVEYQTLSMGFGMYTIDLPAELGRVSAEATLSADYGTMYYNHDRSLTLQTHFAPIEEYTSSNYYLLLWPADHATYTAEERKSITLGDETIEYWFAADKSKCFLWMEGKDPYLAYGIGLEMPAEYRDCLDTILKSFTVNEKLRERYVNKQIARGGNLWMAWDNSIALSAADDWTAAAEPINSRYQLAVTWHDGDQLIMINHAPAGQYQDEAELKKDFASLVMENAEESMGLSASQELWSEVWENTLPGVMNVPVYSMLRTAASADEPHVLYASFIYQGELFNCVFMTMPWVEQEQLDEWTDMLFGISTCP